MNGQTEQRQFKKKPNEGVVPYISLLRRANLIALKERRIKIPCAHQQCPPYLPPPQQVHFSVVNFPPSTLPPSVCFNKNPPSCPHSNCPLKDIEEPLSQVTPSCKQELLNCYNHAWASSMFPNIWKCSFLLPILKKNKPKDNPESYRPIMITPVLGENNGENDLSQTSLVCWEK